MQTVKNEKKSGIMFLAAWLVNFVLINTTGKFNVTVFSETTEANFVPGEDGKNGKYITTLKAIAPDQLEKLRKVFRNEDGSPKSEVPIEDTNGLFMTLSTWEKSGYEKDRIPMKGEEIEVLVASVDNADATAKVLRVQNHRLLSPKQAEKFDVASLILDPAQDTAITAQGAKQAASKDLVHA